MIYRRMNARIDSKILDNITNSIKTKLGDNNAALIGDDLGMLITENIKSVNIINDLNKQFKSIKDNIKGFIW